MISKLIRRARTSEIATVAKNVIYLFDNSNLKSDSFLSSTIEKIRNEHLLIVQSIRKDKPETLLEKKDIIRDGLVRKLNNLINGYVNHPNKSIQSSAGHVKSVFYKFGIGIVQESYDSETTFIDSLLDDLSDVDVKSELENLSGCPAIVESLSDANNDFHQTRLKYINQVGNNNNTAERATDIKYRIASLINDVIVVYLRAMVMVDKEKYTAFALKVGESINMVNTSVHSRSGSKANEISDY
ncbi:MAG: DUF6261 family protein [Bacteroidota bacterium]